MLRVLIIKTLLMIKVNLFYSDSSVASGSPCLEADDEGEETCHEEVTIIPWWEKKNENSDDDMMELSQNLNKGGSLHLFKMIWIAICLVL